MKEFFDKLFTSEKGESLQDTHLRCVLKIYAYLGVFFHIIFSFMFIFLGLYWFVALEVCYFLVLFGTLKMYNRYTLREIAILITYASGIVMFVYITYLPWGCGINLYMFLLIPILLFKTYRNKFTFWLEHLFLLLAYCILGSISMYLNKGTIQLPSLIIMTFGLLNFLKAFASLYLYLYLTKHHNDAIINKLKEDKITLDKDSKIDHLTGLFNRRSLDKFLKTMEEQYRITNKTFGMILFDIDFFKKVNDTYGHLAGDRVLAEISRLIVYSLRKSDSVFRYGGEEFLAVIPGVQNKTEAIELANMIREDVEKLKIDIDGKDISVTISSGITLYDGKDMQENIQRVDDALYKAKNNGRNRAEFIN